MAEPIMVFAGSYHQYKEYLRTYKKTPYEARYIADHLSLKGVRGAIIVRFGTWYERKDREEIEREIALLESPAPLSEGKKEGACD